MIKTKITSNISFSKLSSNINKIIDKALERAASDSSEVSKLNIMNSSDPYGGSLAPLKEATIRTRKQGLLRGDAIPIQKRKKAATSRLTNVGGDKPLFYTGELYKSIKSKKNVLSMAGYGMQHHRGFFFTSGNIRTSIIPRPFIEPLIGEESKDLFIKDIEKALKKWKKMTIY